MHSIAPQVPAVVTEVAASAEEAVVGSDRRVVFREV